MSLDPRISLIFLLVYFTVTLLSPSHVAVIFITLIFIIWYARISTFRRVMKAGIFLLVPTLFIGFLNLFFVTTEFDFVALMVLRFWGLSWLFNWFLHQVTPDDLAQALWAFHVPYRFAWQISLAYRFLPMFREETQGIYQTQISRGIPLDGKIYQKLKTLPAIVIPVFVMTQDRAAQFSTALFARNWDSRRAKTSLYPLKMGNQDWIMLIAGLGIALILTLL
ncbi:MAG: energy-coupling factor transporter transmembrane component T [Candidatus Heimdallarchaeota archaeon]